jgi:hypothetical protein
MKLCPKLYLYSTTLAKIVSYHCMIISCANYLLFLPWIVYPLVIKLLRVKLSNLAMVPC